MDQGYAATSEVRFAVVLYGGVSLAIYMNGIVQELFELVRATAPKGDDGLHVDAAELRGAGPVYRKLGQILDQGRSTGVADGEVRTRFVVDIITGTSAGGINGVFLGKALANDQDISALNHLWIEQGDIAKLLNDRGVSTGNPAVKPQHPPLSLLSGPRMLYQLLVAVDEVSETRRDPVPSPYADAIDLWVTTTDLDGRPETVDTTDQTRLGIMREANYRKTFHFLYDGRPDSAINLFERRWDPMLAFAARCTSSFPGAFQAVQLSDLDDAVDGVGKEAVPGGRDWEDTSSNIGQFFREYGDSEVAIRSRSFADGGYLDNNPVDLVMSTLPNRRAELPVARRILIVDPDPGADVPDVAEARPRTDLVSTVVKAATLPRIQTIGGEVDRILDLRGPLDARRRIYAAVDQALDAEQTPSRSGDNVHDTTPSTPGRSGSVRTVGTDGNQVVDEHLDEASVGDARSAPATTVAEAGYIALRISRTASDVGEVLARVGFPARQYDPDSQQHRFASRLVERWLDGSTTVDAARGQWFLDRWDLSYWLRRINFVHGRAGKRLLGADAEAAASMRAVRSKLDDVYTEFATAARQIRAREQPSQALSRLREVLGAVDPSSSESDVGGDHYPDLRDALDPVLEDFANTINLPAVNDKVIAAIGDDPDLRRQFERFDDYDQATLGVRDLLPGENDDIRVVRVSPRDTKRLVDEERSGPKLSGVRVHHFGAFFDEDWRRRDILWGRLDAAERLICALWPATVDGEAGSTERDQLIDEAHRGIVKQVLLDDKYRSLFELSPLQGNEGVSERDVDHTIGALKANLQADPPDPRQSLQLAARAARVADSVGTGIVRAPGPFAAPTKWIGRVLRLGASLIEVALPNRMQSIVTRHLMDVAIVASILMIILGGFFGGPGVVAFGWTLLLIIVGLKLVVELLRLWFDRKSTMVALVLVGATVVALGLALYAIASWDGWARTAGLLALGVVAGLLLAVSLGTRRDSVRRQSSPVVAGGLALLIIVGLSGFGAAHARNEVARWSCERHGWYRAPIVRVVAASCTATEPANAVSVPR